MLARVRVTVSPGASRSELIVSPEGELRVRVAAPPVQGKANRELIRFLAEHLRVAPSSIAIVRGLASRHKVLEIRGVSQDDVDARVRTIIHPPRDPS